MSIPKFSDEEKQIIADNRKHKTVPELAEVMGRGIAGLYAYFASKGWEPFKKEQTPRPRSHPFRKQNRQLEAVVIQRRIENRKANPK